RTSANQGIGRRARRKSSREPANQQQANNAPTSLARSNWKKNPPSASQSKTPKNAARLRRGNAATNNPAARAARRIWPLGTSSGTRSSKRYLRLKDSTSVITSGSNPKRNSVGFV